MAEGSSFTQTHLTVGDAIVICVALGAIMGGTATAVHSFWPPALSERDRDIIAETRISAQAAQAAALHQDVRLTCALAEMRARGEAERNFNTKQSFAERELSRNDAAQHALQAIPACIHLDR